MSARIVPIGPAAALLLAAVLMIPAGLARAVAPAEPKRLRGPLEGAWRHATIMATDALGADDAARVTLLAYVAAAGRTCDGLAIDRDRYRAAFRRIAEERRTELGDEKGVRSLTRRLAYHLGVSTGVFLGEHALDPVRFCTGAAESVAADPEIAAFFASARDAAP